MKFPANQSDIQWNYDVFLSFRGADTRNNFTGHLYKALTNAGIRTFIDDEELQGGEEIKPELLKAIQESMMSIIVFSKNYASSRWCLDELRMILASKRTMRQIVLPVFYDVEPSVVRHQTGIYGEAFDHHLENKELNMVQIHMWRAALREAADLSGHSLRNEENGNESKLIQKIVMEVLPRVNSKCLILPDNLVGISPHVSSINKLINFDADYDVLTLGIHGMGGIGKTTISKAVYNYNMHRFEACSFVDNVRDGAKLPDGLVRLQEKLLSQLLNQNVKVHSVDDGINGIRRICRLRKVLLLLDDVDNIKQLKLLAGDTSCFGLGSRIIITTRDIHLLKQANVDRQYAMMELSEKESLELFSLHAFRKPIIPSNDYRLLSDRIVKYARGLPLALEVIGLYLVERSLEEWRSALKKLHQIPLGEIQEKLKVSFDALVDYKVKEMFLDLACFFIGMDKDFAVSIWDACGFFAEDGIRNLEDKGLVKIDENNKLRMHDLLRDMGREIIRNQSPKWPSERSRILLTDGVLDVITAIKEAYSIEGISIDHPSRVPIQLDAKIFEAMPRLRLLEMKNVDINGSFEYIFQELRWLSWQFCTLSHLPSEFSPRNLVMLDMQYSNMRKLWHDLMHLQNLRILNLGFCKFLKETPDFTRVPNLEWLSLRGCKKLVELHPSLGRLYKLHHLDLIECKNLGSYSILKCFDSSCDTKRSDLFLYLDSEFYYFLPHDIHNIQFLHIRKGTLMDAVVDLLEAGLRLAQRNWAYFVTQSDMGRPIRESQFSQIQQNYDSFTESQVIRSEVGVVEKKYKNLWIEQYNSLLNRNVKSKILPHRKKRYDRGLEVEVETNYNIRSNFELDLNIELQLESDIESQSYDRGLEPDVKLQLKSYDRGLEVEVVETNYNVQLNSELDLNIEIQLESDIESQLKSDQIELQVEMEEKSDDIELQFEMELHLEPQSKLDQTEINWTKIKEFRLVSGPNWIGL